VDTGQILAQIIGVVLIAVTLLSPHFKTRHGMLATILAANALSCVMFFFVDSRAGLFALIVTTIRSVAYWAYSIKDKQAPKYVLAVFVVFQIAATAIGWTSWFSALTLGLLFNTYGQWQTSPKILRICLFASAILIGTYCLYTGAFTGAFNKFIQAGSVVVALYRNRKSIANQPDTAQTD